MKILILLIYLLLVSSFFLVPSLAERSSISSPVVSPTPAIRNSTIMFNGTLNDNVTASGLKVWWKLFNGTSIYAVGNRSGLDNNTAYNFYNLSPYTTKYNEIWRFEMKSENGTNSNYTATNTTIAISRNYKLNGSTATGCGASCVFFVTRNSTNIYAVGGFPSGSATIQEDSFNTYDTSLNLISSTLTNPNITMSRGIAINNTGEFWLKSSRDVTISANGHRIWLVDSLANNTQTFISTRDSVSTDGSVSGAGLTYNGTHFWITGENSSIYEYTLAGLQRTLFAPSLNPFGLYGNNTDFWFTEGSSTRMYRYSFLGENYNQPLDIGNFISANYVAGIYVTDAEILGASVGTNSFIFQLIPDNSPFVGVSNSNKTYLNNSDSWVRLSVNVTDQTGINPIDEVTVDIIRPDGTINVTNISMSASSKDFWEYNFSVQSNFQEGNWTVVFYANDSINDDTGRNSLWFIIDKTLPQPIISRDTTMGGVLRGNQVNISINFLDAWFSNWTLNITNSAGVMRSVYNSTGGNATFRFNSTSSDPVGNWTAYLTVCDRARNCNTTNEWFGLASVSVNNETRFESGNFTTLGTAWGEPTAIGNNSVTDYDYVKVFSFTWSGICSANCTTSTSFNITQNLTGRWIAISVNNHTNSTQNFTRTNTDVITFSDNATLPVDQTLTQETRVRITVPNSLIAYLKRDGAILYYGVDRRNVSNSLFSNDSYVRFATIGVNVFDSTTSHPEYNGCIAAADTTADPPTCSTLETTVDVMDSNNGNNTPFDVGFDGPSNARNIRYARMSFFPDFLFRETIQGGGTAGGEGGGTGGSGGGGGGGGPIITLPILQGTDKCPAGFILRNVTGQGEICDEVGLKTPDISESGVALLTVALVAGGALYIQTKGKKNKIRKELEF